MILEYTTATRGMYVEIPLNGDVNVFIDWGDDLSTVFSGTLDMYNHIGHSFNEAGRFEVKIYGSAGAMHGSLVNPACLSAIVEWGELGIRGLYCAFRGSSIETIPDGYQEFFKEVVTFERTFQGCKKLKEIPADLFNDLPEITGFGTTFWGCSALTTIPATLFDGTTNVTSVRGLFRECSSLASIPEGLFDGMTNLNDALTCFDGCTSLKVAPAHLFAANTKLSDATSLFRDSGIVSVEEGFLANCPDLRTVDQIFSANRSLKTIPTSLFDNNRKISVFSQAFSNCTELTGESPYSMIGGNKVHLYERSAHGSEFTVPANDRVSIGGCFYNCTKLSDYNSIPDGWWKNSYR
jgi:hypothetical protein